MTRKDYDVIAAALRDALDDHQRAGRYSHAEGILDAAIVLSRRMQGENPRLDRVKFLLAAGCPANARIIDICKKDQYFKEQQA